jgi:spore coat polysaccharide biosynthesis predicted glycosyltransferase SpsG
MPNRKTRIIDELRLKSKALFKTSLKTSQPIVIKDDDSPKFSSMEEMVVNVLKGMTVKMEKLKSNEVETIETSFVTMRKEYPTDYSQ